MKSGSKLAYTGGALVAIAIGALALFSSGVSGPAPIAPELLTGQMQRLSLPARAIAAPEDTFTHEDGHAARISDFRGKVLVVNFWATWCAPCRKEMPSLARLQAQLGPEAEVLTIAVGPGNGASADFMAEIGVDNLPLHRDPRQALSRALGVLGLPVTVIFDKEGREVARLVGDAEWDQPEVLALIEALDEAAR